ncbi:MAG: hypothetical protein GY861_13070 [bacterium]|nr:hypothetical protein [bacterium]
MKAVKITNPIYIQLAAPEIKKYVDFSHMCWHPVDTGGSVEEYNAIEIGWSF